MPELAEVEYFRRCWDPGLGRKVLDVRIHPESRVFRDCTNPFRIPEVLTGQRLASSHAHGKRLLFGFSGSAWLGVHLGMTGRLFCAGGAGGGAGPAALMRPGAPVSEPERHHHLVIAQRGQDLVFSDPRMFGAVTLERSRAIPAWWRNLPPQVQSPEFTRRHFDAGLARHPNRPVKAHLLDQRHFPGFGNWMADEVLWRARLHPAARTGELDRGSAATLYRASRQVARDALRVIAPDWSRPPDRWLFNHRWEPGGHCPRRCCGSPLARDTHASRTTSWCPRCQARR